MPITLHNLRPAAGAKHRTKRIGRGTGSGHGTTATKGTKGQRARQGGRKRLRALGMKYLVQSTPKLPGFTSIYPKVASVPVGALNRFADGTTVSLTTLIKARLVPTHVESAKIIGDGKLNRKLIIVKIPATDAAKKRITAAGGSLT